MRYLRETMPALWWLFPWALARDLFKAARALQSIVELDDVEIRLLEAEIIAGRAVVPDAEPVAEEGGQP